MAGKNTIARRIDTGGSSAEGSEVVATTEDTAPPAIKSIPEPENLVLQAFLGRSAVTPTAYISATWDRPVGTEPQEYVLQVSTSNSFPAGGTTTFKATDESATLDGLKTSTTYYVRVAAVYRAIQSSWSDAASVATPADTTPPDPVSSVATNFSTGDLLITWANPASDNLKDVQVDIYASNGGTLLRTAYSAVGRYVWTAQQNYTDTAGAYDASVYIVLRARSYGNVYSTQVTTTATKSAPSTPSSVTTSWSSDTGTAAPDCKFTWTYQANLAYYILTIDGQTRQVAGAATEYVYHLSTNANEHSGTPDPTLSWSIVAVDRLGQSSTAASGTATNAAPPTPSVTAQGFFSTVAVAISFTTDPLDLDYYMVEAVSGMSTFATAKSKSKDVILQLDAARTFQVVVTPYDVFGQAGTAGSTGTMTVDGITLDQLRSEASYTDSIGTNFTTIPNKTVLRDDITGAGITYAASASAWRWTQIERQLTERYRRVSVRLGSGSANFYVGVSSDGATWAWYAGVGGDGYTLTARASEAAAQSAAALVLAAINGWVELPTTVEGRYIRLGHRNTVSSYRLDEFYAYTLIIADMIRAGDIKALHIGAGQVTADKINVATLSAITADMGSLTAGTITGATIRTAASGTRVEMTSAGLKTYTGSTVVTEVATGTSGAINIYGTAALNFRLIPADSVRGEIGYDGTTTTFRMYAPSGNDIYLYSASGDITLRGGGGNVNITNSTSLKVTSGGVTVGSATAATAGQIRSESLMISESNGVRSWGTSAGLTFEDRVAGNMWQWYGSTTARLHNGSADTLRVNTSGDLEVVRDVDVSRSMGVGGAAISAATKINILSSIDNSTSWGIVYKMTDGTTNNFFVQGNGAGFLRAAAWTYGSDRRLKENILPLESTLERLLQLRPVRFDYIDGEAQQVGFVAQEVQAVLPELVREVDETGLLGMQTTNLIPMLVQALQELVTHYRADLAALRADIAALQAV